MPRIATGGVIGPLALNRQAAPPLYRQLYERSAGADPERPAGARQQAALDARCWRQSIGVSRNTVLQAFDQLMGEGYVEGRRGAGSFVSRDLPHRPPAARSAAASAARPLRRDFARAAAPSAPSMGARSRSPCRLRRASPDVRGFPGAISGRGCWRGAGAGSAAADYAAGDRAGHRPLRAAIADYLAAERAVRCSADQVLIVSGIRQAIDLTLRVLARSAATPSGWRSRAIAASAPRWPRPAPRRCRCRSTARARRRRPARGWRRGRGSICISPSHQYPLGITMSLARRLELLDYARRARAWVLEDDYDSEFRYSRPAAGGAAGPR